MVWIALLLWLHSTVIPIRSREEGKFNEKKQELERLMVPDIPSTYLTQAEFNPEIPSAYLTPVDCKSVYDASLNHYGYIDIVGSLRSGKESIKRSSQIYHMIGDDSEPKYEVV